MNPKWQPTILYIPSFFYLYLFRAYILSLQLLINVEENVEEKKRNGGWTKKRNLDQDPIV